MYMCDLFSPNTVAVVVHQKMKKLTLLYKYKLLSLSIFCHRKQFILKHCRILCRCIEKYNLLVLPTEMEVDLILHCFSVLNICFKNTIKNSFSLAVIDVSIDYC